MKPSVFRAFVGGLLDPGCPATVGQFVSRIIIHSFEGQPRRWIAHIGQEILKFVPALAYRDPAPAVVLESRDARIVAAREHVVPTAIGFAPQSTNCVSVRNESGAVVVATETAAREPMASAHIVTHYAGRRSAIADAMPVPSILSEVITAIDDETAKAAACKVFGGHGYLSPVGACQVTAGALARSGRRAL
jgi:hypothetical protein